MSDILPKVKGYIFVSIISLIINIGIILVHIIQVNSIDLSTIGFTLAGMGSSFIPFVSMLPLTTLDIPTEILLLLGLFTGIISAYQLILMAMMLLQIIANVIWNPDV